MKCFVVSTMCSKKTYTKLVKKEYRTSQQCQKYMRLLCNGLAYNGARIVALSTPPINRNNCNYTVIHEKKENSNRFFINYIFTINLPILKNILNFWGVFFNIIKYAHSKDSIIIVDLLSVTTSIAAFIASKIIRKKVLGILTDMPAVYVDNENKKVSIQKKINQWICERGPDCYLFLTEAMNSYVNKKNKPYVVVEGFSDINMKSRSKKYDKESFQNYCFYAGGINKLYGIDMLVEGFIDARIPNYSLKICGDGPYVNELKKICKDNHQVEYLGVIDNTEVLKLEEMATLLINPRYTNSDFTKYSFPSKNMEYMSTGTPVLTTKLAGMPKEYYPYVYLLEDESINGMATKLKQLLLEDVISMSKKGIEAKTWILDKKNNYIGTKELFILLDKMSIET